MSGWRTLTMPASNLVWVKFTAMARRTRLAGVGDAIFGGNGFEVQ